MKLLVFEYGQFKHAQREKTPKLVRLRVVMLGITLGGVVWNLIYWHGYLIMASLLFLIFISRLIS